MQTMVRPVGVLAVVGGTAWSRSATSASCGCPCDRLPAAECVSVQSSSTVLDSRGWSKLKLRLRAIDRKSGSSSASCDRFQRFRVRAEKKADDVAEKIGADTGAVEKGGEAVKVDKAAELILIAQDEVEKRAKEPTLESATGLNTPPSSGSDVFFKDVEDAGNAGSAASVGSAEIAKVDGDAPPSEGELSRSQTQQKIVETAKDGIEVLKWAAEGVVSAGMSAKQGLEAARELVDKRLKSFGLAADETKEVSSQVAEVAQKEFGKLQESATKFGEEFQVNVDDKKAADSLKPESEVSPLTKFGSDIQESVAKATSEDGPIKDLSDTLSEGFAKVSKAGQQFAEESTKKGEEIASAVSKKRDEFADKGKEISSSAEDKGKEISSSAENKGKEMSASAESKGKEISSSAEKTAGDAEKDLKSD